MLWRVELAAPASRQAPYLLPARPLEEEASPPLLPEIVLEWRACSALAKRLESVAVSRRQAEEMEAPSQPLPLEVEVEWQAFAALAIHLSSLDL